MNSSKIFVRYIPGASGHFVSLLLLSLIKDTNLTENHRAHQQIDAINAGHNFNTQWSDDFKKYTSINANLADSINWIQQNFYFTDIDQQYYVIHTHVVNPKPLLLAFNNTKLINIKSTKENSDQLAYNWITKSCFLYRQWDMVNNWLQVMHNRYNKLNHIKTVDEHTELKLLTYIQKFRCEHLRNQFEQILDYGNKPVFTIMFDDILSGKLSDQLDDLIEFVGVEVSIKQKNKALELINVYSNAQISVPWVQEINEYN